LAAACDTNGSSSSAIASRTSTRSKASRALVFFSLAGFAFAARGFFVGAALAFFEVFGAK
jgi:hypothetical protein